LKLLEYIRPLTIHRIIDLANELPALFMTPASDIAGESSTTAHQASPLVNDTKFLAHIIRTTIQEEFALLRQQAYIIQEETGLFGPHEPRLETPQPNFDDYSAHSPDHLPPQAPQAPECGPQDHSKGVDVGDFTPDVADNVLLPLAHPQQMMSQQGITLNSGKPPYLIRPSAAIQYQTQTTGQSIRNRQTDMTPRHRGNGRFPTLPLATTWSRCGNG